MNKFAIVQFVSEDSVAIVSTNWLTEDKATCRYPSGPNFEKLLKRHAIPAADWKEYPVKVMREDYDYSNARRYLLRAEDTSNLDSDPEECVKRKRQVPVRFTFDSDEEEEFSKKIPYKKQNKISPYPSLDSFLNISSPLQSSVCNISSSNSQILPISSNTPSVSSLNTPSVSSLNTPSVSSLNINTPSVSSNIPSFPCVIPSISSSFHPIGSNSAVPVSSQLSPVPFYAVPSRTSEIDSRLAMVIGQLQSTIADLVLEVREMGKKLDRVVQSGANCDDGVQKEMALIGRLPITTIESFEEFEDGLKDINFHNLLVKVLISLGGRDFKTFIYNILRRLLSCQLANKFSFTGKQPKDKEKDKKRAFCSTLIYKSIQASSRKVYPDVKEEALKNHVSLWLQQAKQRQNRREENKEKGQCAGKSNEE